MNNIRIEVYRSGAIPPHIYITVSALLHDAFAERREQGINFQCGTFSSKDVENEFSEKGGFLLLAINDKGTAVGTVSLIEHHKGKLIYISHDNLAVSSNCKGNGIASKLFKEALNIAGYQEYDFITSFTATIAESSLAYHEKMGFIIYEKSFGKDYNSYSFIYPLRKFKFMRLKPFSMLVYSLLTLFNKLKKK